MRAGILGGMAVGAFVAAADIVRGSPFATPLFIGHVLVEQAAPAVTDTALAGVLVGASLGMQLATVTGLLLLCYTAAGLFAAELGNLFRIRWNARIGLVVGALFGAIAWMTAEYLGSWFLRSGGLLSLEVASAANALGGAVVGWYLNLSMREAEQPS